MIIGAKLACIDGQIEDREKRNVKYAELHTNPWEFLENVDYNMYKEKLKNIDIISVHSPMQNNRKKPCGIGYLGYIENSEYQENMDLIKESIKLANEIIKLENKVIVIHMPELFNIDISDTEKENIKKNVIEDMKKLSTYAKSISDNIILAFENSIRPVGILETGFKEIMYGTSSEVIECVEEVNEENVGITLDICHVLATIQLEEELGKIKYKTVEDYIQNYSTKLKHVHLSNSKNYGIKEGHGLPFLYTEEDINMLERIFKSLNDIKYRYNIVIETLEKDINNAENYTITLNKINICKLI